MSASVTPPQSSDSPTELGATTPAAETSFTTQAAETHVCKPGEPARTAREAAPSDGSPKPPMTALPAEKSHAQLSTTDIWSSRLAAWAQIGTLIVLIVGYFFTVRPAFQLQLLQEKASKLELERQAARTDLERTLARHAEAQAKLAAVNRSLAQIVAERETLVSALTDAEREQEVARQLGESLRAAVDRNRTLAASTSTQLEQAQWRLFGIYLRSEYLNPREQLETINEALRGPSSVRRDREGLFIVTAAEHWPDPYALLSRALDALEQQAKDWNEFPLDFVALYRKEVNAQRDELVCDAPPISDFRRKFQAELASTGPIVEEKLDEYIEKVRLEQKKPFRRLLITEEFKSAVRAQYQDAEDFEIQQKYFNRVDELRFVCEAKGSTFIIMHPPGSQSGR